MLRRMLLAAEGEGSDFDILNLGELIEKAFETVIQNTMFGFWQGLLISIVPKDLLWIADNKDELLSSVITDIFDSVFHQKIDLIGDSIDTPEGYNIKRYGVYNGQYGIYKQRINPLTTDVESEIAVYLLAQELGVPCCPAYRIGKDTMFSAFLYNFSKEYIVHFRRLFDGVRSGNEYHNLVSVRPQYKDEIAQMILLDFITRQDDRHLSNIAIKMSGASESFYPLYRPDSLCYEFRFQQYLLRLCKRNRRRARRVERVY